MTAGIGVVLSRRATRVRRPGGWTGMGGRAETGRGGRSCRKEARERVRRQIRDHGGGRGDGVDAQRAGNRDPTAAVRRIGRARWRGLRTASTCLDRLLDTTPSDFQISTWPLMALARLSRPDGRGS